VTYSLEEPLEPVTAPQRLLKPGKAFLDCTPSTGADTETAETGTRLEKLGGACRDERSYRCAQRGFLDRRLVTDIEDDDR
jgi:hypothetical protein